jgi:hypothetical protein
MQEALIRIQLIGSMATFDAYAASVKRSLSHALYLDNFPILNVHLDSTRKVATGTGSLDYLHRV